MLRNCQYITSANIDLLDVYRESDGSKYKPVGLRRSEWTFPVGIRLDYVQHVHGTTDQRDLFLGRWREHAELPAAVVTHPAVLLRVA